MADGWLEPRTRIPFIGIMAITVIVAVVAIFIRAQLAPLFPESTVEVESGDALTGRATSDTFYGLREIDLSRKELLQGTLQSREATKFTVDAANRLLNVNDEEVVLQPMDDRLIATFEYQGANTRVEIDGAERTLTLTRPGTSALTTVVQLSDIVVYRGSFTYRNQQHVLELQPATKIATIRGQDTATIQMAGDDKLYGTWTEGKQKRPIIIDLKAREATIEDIY
jgi:hypothetical protein